MIYLFVKSPTIGYIAEVNGDLAITTNKKQAKVYLSEEYAFKDRYKATKALGAKANITFEINGKVL